MPTISATDTVSQLIELFPPHERPQIRGLLARALRGIVCQRLLPRAGGRGRVPAVEVLVVNNAAGEAMLEGKTDRLEGIMREGEYYEMQTFDQSLLALYRRGLVERDEALHHATYGPALRVELEQVDRTRGAVTGPTTAPLAPPGPPPVGTLLASPGPSPLPPMTAPVGTAGVNEEPAAREPQQWLGARSRAAPSVLREWLARARARRAVGCGGLRRPTSWAARCVTPSWISTSSRATSTSPRTPGPTWWSGSWGSGPSRCGWRVATSAPSAHGRPVASSRSPRFAPTSTGPRAASRK